MSIGFGVCGMVLCAPATLADSNGRVDHPSRRCQNHERFPDRPTRIDVTQSRYKPPKCQRRAHETETDRGSLNGSAMMAYFSRCNRHNRRPRTFIVRDLQEGGGDVDEKGSLSPKSIMRANVVSIDIYEGKGTSLHCRFRRLSPRGMRGGLVIRVPRWCVGPPAASWFTHNSMHSPHQGRSRPPSESWAN